MKTTNDKMKAPFSYFLCRLATIILLVNSAQKTAANTVGNNSPTSKKYGRVSTDEYILTPEQMNDFHSNGCCTLPNVLTEEEVQAIESTFDKFLNREIHVPGKDFCDMSKPFNTPFEEWSIVNCMLPTKYHPPFQRNVYERLCTCIAAQLFPKLEMTKGQ